MKKISIHDCTSGPHYSQYLLKMCVSVIVLKTVLFTLKKMFQALNQLKTKTWLHLKEFKLASADRKTS